MRHLLLDIQLFIGLPDFWLNYLAVASWGFSTIFFGEKKKSNIQLWHVGCCALSRASLASFLLRNIQYPQWFPLIWAVHHPVSASIVCESNFARYSIIEYSASSHDFTWDNSVVACWGFPINLFFGKKIYRILNFNMKYSAADSGPVWLGFSCGISIIHHVYHWCEQWINMHLPVWYESSWWRLLPL